jgi:hypothetical protein
VSPQLPLSPNKPEKHSPTRKRSCDDDVNPKIRGDSQSIVILRIREEIGAKQCLRLIQLQSLDGYDFGGTHTAKKVAGRKMADINAIVIIELVSRVDCSVSLFISLFSATPCSVNLCISKLVCLPASVVRMSCILCTYAFFFRKNMSEGEVETYELADAARSSDKSLNSVHTGGLPEQESVQLYLDASEASVQSWRRSCTNS